jgi:small conductance mechanosensitive channel
MAVLRQVGAELMEEPAWRPYILEPLEVLGVEGFDSTQVTLKARLKTVPLKQWDVGRELRRRIKKRFDEAGIASPVRQLTVRVGNRELAALADLAGRSEHR